MIIQGNETAATKSSTDMTTSKTQAPSPSLSLSLLTSRFRRINSFRLFLWLVCSCSMGWFVLLLAFLRQSPSPSLLQQQQSSSSMTTPSVASVRTDHVLSLLQFMNTSAGHVYPKEEPFADCIYLLTVVLDNTTTTKTTTKTTTHPPQSFSITLMQSLNGYWKHPVGIRRRQLTPNLKLLQDAVQALERDIIIMTTNNTTTAASPITSTTTESSRILWSALQATSLYSSSIPPTSSHIKNMTNATNDNLDFVTTVPRLGIIPLIINWKPTVPFTMPIARGVALVSNTDTVEKALNDCWLDTTVLVLRDAIPRRCCPDDDTHTNDKKDATPFQRCSQQQQQQQQYTIPNAPLILQVQTVEQQLLKTPWAFCSLDSQGMARINGTLASVAILPLLETTIPTPTRQHATDKATTTTVLVVGVRIPHDEKANDSVSEPFLTWMRNIQEELRPDVLWEVNQHEDDHDIILDFTFNWTLFCQPHTLILKVFPTSLADPLTVSVGKWRDSLFVPLTPGDILQDQDGKLRNKSGILEIVQRAQRTWNDTTKRKQMLEAKQCWCGQHMKYKVLVDHVLHAWAYYNQHILNGNYQLWKEEFPIYAAGHFWKRPGGDSWSLPLSVVGGIKGGLRADVHYGSAII